MTDEARQPTEEEMRAAYEAEIKKIRIEQILLENIVTLINLGMRKTGLIPGTEDERDAAQVRVAVEGVAAHLPLIDQIAPEQASQIKDALSQLQMAFVQISGGTVPDPSEPSAAQQPPAEKPAERGGPGPAQQSGRLWIPGQ